MNGETDLQELLDRGWSEARAVITDGLTAAAVVFAVVAAASAGCRMLRAAMRHRANAGAAARVHGTELMIGKGDRTW